MKRDRNFTQAFDAVKAFNIEMNYTVVLPEACIGKIGKLLKDIAQSLSKLKNFEKLRFKPSNYKNFLVVSANS